MAITLNCGQCGVRLRMGDDKAGKTVRCPKCGHVFRVAAPQSQQGEWELVEDEPAPSPVVPAQSQDNVDEESQTTRTTLPRKAKKLKKRQGDPLRMVKLVGGIVAGVLGAGVGVYLLFVFLGLAGKASGAYAEFADILEKSATAMENARDVNQRSSAAQQLTQQASRLESWLQKYANEKEEEWAVKKAQARYEDRINAACQRITVAQGQLEQDPDARKDAQLQAAMQKWSLAIGSVLAAAEDARNPAAKFRVRGRIR